MKNYHNSITVDMFGHSFFHNYACTGDDNIYFFQNDKISNNVKKFITQMINMNSSKFSYGKQFRQQFADNLKILLPVTSSGEIDYEFMESFIQKLENAKLGEYKEYAKKRVNEILFSKKIENVKLEEKNWEEFVIGDIFQKFIQGKSKGLNHLIEKNGSVPYLGATNKNNGVLTFVNEEKSMIQKGNCICFIRNGQGSVGYSVYKKESFISTSDNTIAYADWLNFYTGNFIVTCSDMIRSKYSFGYKRNNERLLKDKIILPTTPAGEPDYLYMENYIKDIMLKKYTEYFEFKNINHYYSKNLNNGLLKAAQSISDNIYDV